MWYRVFVARFDYIIYGVLAMHFGIIHYMNMSVTMLNIGQKTFSVQVHGTS